jgi:exosortase
MTDTNTGGVDAVELEQDRRSDENSSVSKWLWIGLYAMAIPMMIVYLLKLWHFEHYRFFPFVFIVIGILAFYRVDTAIKGLSGWISLPATALAVFVILLGTFAGSPWTVAVGFVILTFVALGSQSGSADRSLIGLAVPALLLIRLPLGYDQALINKLQSITSNLASVSLDLLSIPHSVTANVIQLADRELFVAEACSGIQSVFTLCFIASVFIAYNRRRLWLIPIYFLSAIVLAIFCNVIRVAGVATAESLFHYDLASGWQHDLLGYFTLALGVFFLWSADQLVDFALPQISEASDESHRNPLVLLWSAVVGDDVSEMSSSSLHDRSSGKGSRRRSPGSGWSTILQIVRRPAVQYGLAAFLGVLCIASSVVAWNTRISSESFSNDLIFNTDESLFDVVLASRKPSGHVVSRYGSNPRLGNHADLWNLSFGDSPAQLVLSQSYIGWHELCYCYEVTDWKLVNREVIRNLDEPETENLDDSTLAVHARFKHPKKGEGTLFYCAISPEGDTLHPPKLPGRFRDPLASMETMDSQKNVMMQIWITTDQPLSREQRQEVRRDFFKAIEKLSSAMRASQGDETQSTAPDQMNNVEG